ncbi:MAG: CNNM domain-containing protein [Elusimicrobiota bacterium]
MTLVAIIVGVSLGGSFFCSLMEAALYSVPLSRIETLRRLRRPGGERLAVLRQNVNQPIAAILAMNTVFNAMGGVLAGALVQLRYGDHWLMPFSLVFTAAILVFSEITPKSLGVRFADRVAPRIARPLQFLVWALWPYVWVAEGLTRLFGESARISAPTEEDIVSAVLLSLAGGKILPQEARWLRNALRLNDIKTRDIMTPYSKIRRVPEKMPLSMTKVEAAHWRFKRILVCKSDSPDTIVGVVYRHTVFRAIMDRKPDATMADLMRPVRFVRDDLPITDLLNLFLRYKTQIAAVEDGRARLVGVVTLEDVLEDMIGAEIE